MPKVIFLLGWNPRRGLHIIGQYPPDIELDKDTLLDYFGLALQKGDAKSFSELEHKGERIIMYFTGMTTKMAFGAIVDEDENIDLLRGAMVRAVLELITKQAIPASIDAWSAIFEKMVLYQGMSIEEKVGELFSDPLFIRLFEKISEFGVIKYETLLEELRVLTGSREEEIIRAYIESLTALNITQLYYDEESMREYIYLLRDVAIIRKRPEKYDEIANIVNDYKSDYQQWVSEYMESKKWKEDQGALARVFSDPRFYRTLKFFREKGIISKSDIEIMDRTALEFLILNDICRGNEDYIYMFTDVAIVLMFPKYSIHRCLQNYASDMLTLQEVKKYLEAIKKSYL